MKKGMKTAAWLLCSGLAIQALSLGWAHPTAFLLFLGAGGLLVAAGLLRYLLAVASSGAGKPQAGFRRKPSTPWP